MIYRNILMFASIILFAFTTSVWGNDPQSIDSTKVADVVTDFYSWYLSAINHEINDDFNPKFCQGRNGMTTLDMANYIGNLKKHHFSKSLINNEIASYDKCLDRIQKIPYSEFGNQVFIDLDEYEESDCDFGNYYRWIGGMEPISAFHIIDVKFEETDKAVVLIEGGDWNEIKNEYSYWIKKTIELKRNSGKWEILQIN